MLLRALLTALALTSGACGGCGRPQGVPDEDLGRLVLAAPDTAGPVDLAKAGRDPGELGRALGLPVAATVTALGKHTTTLTSSSTVTEGTTTVSELADKTVLELGEGRSFHGIYDNTGDLGRETIFLDAPTGALLYLRPRYQRWHARAAEHPEEPEQLRDAYLGAVAATWDLLAPAAELTDRGAATVAGRAGRTIEVKLSPTPPKLPTEPHTQRKWRETRTVDAVSGTLVLDTDTGVLLSAKLAGQITFMRDGRRFAMTLAVESTVSGLGTAVALAAPPPTDVVATPERRREVDERDALLQGLAPPTRRGGTAPPIALPAAPEPPSPNETVKPAPAGSAAP